MENRIRTQWSRGQAALSGWLHIPSGFSAELMGGAGFDALTLDLQHGLLDFSTALGMLQALGGSTVLARVPWNEPGLIMKLLDAGVNGIICPMINNRSEAEAFVGACRYPPNGYRSFGPTRAALLWGNNYAQQTDATLVKLAMIETAEGLDNLEEIVATPGLDGVFVGPNDLGQALGLGTGLDREEPQMWEALERIARTALAAGVMPGIFCATPEYAQRMQALGYRFLALSSDARLLGAAARSLVTAFREGGLVEKVGGY
jgi:4-hydroxy-2-oxoheptanedioate aldolase